MKILICFLFSLSCYSATRVITLKNTDTGKVTHKVTTDDDSFVMKIPKGWGYTDTNAKITIEDITSQVQAQEAQELSRKEEIAQIKADLETITNSELPAWHKKILKRLIKEMKE